MTNAELNELKHILLNYFESGIALYQVHLNQLLALIDAEMAKQTPDAEIDEAIDAIKKNWPPENYTMLRKGLNLAITALERMKGDRT